MKQILLLALCLLVSDTVFAQPQGKAGKPKGDENVRIMVETPKPYGAVIARIRDMGGEVHYEFKHVDGLVATLPQDQLEAFSKSTGIGEVRKDQTITRQEPRAVERAGFGSIERHYELDARELTGDVVPFQESAPNGYFPYEADLIGASEFWGETGKQGEGVVIGIMDSGLSEVDAIAGRIAGGESFLPYAPSIDDGLPAISSGNGAHGTWVATAAGANVLFGFLSTSPFAQAIARYLPEAALPDAFGPGTIGVPMVGPAPAAKFYALKTFNKDGLTSTSVILAAFDRAIELKQMADAGNPAGVDLRVLNGSFGGSTTFAGDDPFFAGMVEALTEAGIVTVFSAGNTGPSGITGGDPGVARSTLTVGASSVAAYEKIFIDVAVAPGYGLPPGTGEWWRANDLHQTAYFSSRGPTADGRPDPDLTAPGDYIFAQSPTGSLSLVSGTSFSAPIVAGAAALLISEFPDATPDQIRGALLAGADPNVLQDGSGRFDQGAGFLDVAGALERFGAPNPPDVGQENPNVKVNVQKLGVPIVSSRSASHTTGWLLPGQREELFIETGATDVGMTVTVSVTAELPPAQQNQLFTDDAFVAIHSAKTSSIGEIGDYRAGTPAFVGGTETFRLEANDLEEGLTRVTLMGDGTNAGRIQANVQITRDKEGLHSATPINGHIGPDELSAPYTVEVAPGTSELSLLLDWKHGWDHWPTADLDLYAIDPDGNLTLVDADEDGDFEGLSLDVPERLTVQNPAAGTWTLSVAGFDVWNKGEKYQLFVDTGAPEAIAATPSRGKGKHLGLAAVPEKYALAGNFPNPFSAATEIAFDLPEPTTTQLVVYDVTGREVARLVDGPLPAGSHRIRWETGALPSGVYLSRLTAGEFTAVQRLVLLK